MQMLTLFGELPSAQRISKLKLYKCICIVVAIAVSIGIRRSESKTLMLKQHSARQPLQWTSKDYTTAQRLAMKGESTLDEWRPALNALRSANWLENMSGQSILVTLCGKNPSEKAVVEAILEDSVIHSSRLSYLIAYSQLDTLSQITSSVIKKGTPTNAKPDTTPDLREALEFGQGIEKHGVVPLRAKTLLSKYLNKSGVSAELICQAILLGACRGTAETRTWADATCMQLIRLGHSHDDMSWSVLHEMASQHLLKNIYDGRK